MNRDRVEISPQVSEFIKKCEECLNNQGQESNNNEEKKHISVNNKQINRINGILGSRK